MILRASHKKNVSISVGWTGEERVLLLPGPRPGKIRRALLGMLPLDHPQIAPSRILAWMDRDEDVFAPYIFTSRRAESGTLSVTYYASLRVSLTYYWETRYPSGKGEQ